MRVRFAKDVIQDSAPARHLDEILGTIEDGWHEWDIDDPNMLESSLWYAGARQHIHALFKKATVASTYPRTGLLHQRLWIVALQTTQDKLSPQSAARLFRRPLCVCLENQFTDGKFLDAVLSVLAPPELKVFFDQCAHKPYGLGHGGGSGELKKVIEQHLFEAAADGIPLRAVVFTDGDARFPEENGKRQEAPLAIASLCRENAIDCLILSKRAIENYIPDEVLQGWAGKHENQAARPRVEAICRLSGEQRDHYPLKNGLPKTFDTNEEKALYATLDTTVVSLLQERGFGNKLIELLDTHRECLTAEGFRKRDGRAELDKLVAMIIQAL